MSQDKYYSEYYQKILNTGAIGFVSSFVHKKLEPKSIETFDTVLEVGAGHGQHLTFVKHNFSQYFETDFRKENLPDRSPESKVTSLICDATNLVDFGDQTVNRIIATCLIIHLDNPESALLEWRRVCAEGGLISIYVACEPGLLLRLVRHFTTVRKAKKLGLNHLSFHYREHVTFFSRIDMLIEEIFADDKICKLYWPFRVPFFELELGVFYQIRISKKSS